MFNEIQNKVILLSAVTHESFFMGVGHWYQDDD